MVQFISMMYSPKTFSLPVLNGLSEKQISVHLALYEGYVKNVNSILENPGTGRFSFEFDGMRMHEYYFDQLEGGQHALQENSALKDIEEKVRVMALTRGIGWVVGYYDPRGKALHTTFVNDHEIGQLAGLPIILALDLWEHAYLVDYVPAEKKNYIDAFFSNINWGVVEKRFDDAMKMSAA